MAQFRNDYFKKFTNEGIEFMENREAGDINELVGVEVTISDYGFIKDSSAPLGKYGVFTVEGDNEHFYFAPSVVSDVLNTVEEDGMKSALCGSQKVVFLKKKSRKTKRDYIYIEFI